MPIVVSGLEPEIDKLASQERFDRLRESYADHDKCIAELERFVRTAPDDKILRINSIQYAAEHGREEAQIINLFLHAPGPAFSSWSGTVRAGDAGASSRVCTR